MLKQIEGSPAVAEAAALCRPQVICAYPSACPDNAVVKVDAGQYVIDYDYCKGCGICAAECPCGSIAMVPEDG